MAGNHVQRGDVIDYTLTGTVAAGGVIEFADSIGVALVGGVSGDVVAVALGEVFELAKETGVAFAVGDFLYWDASNDNLDKTGTNIPAGLCVEAAASGATTAKVLLNRGAIRDTDT